MKIHCLIIALAVTMVTGMTLSREKRQNYDALLQNKAFVVSQINCVLRRGQCDRIGNRIRILVPEVVKNKVCSSCTEDEKGNVQKVADHVEQNYPKEWNEIREQYTEKEESEIENENGDENEELVENAENEEETTSSSLSSAEKSGKSAVVSEQAEAEIETESGSGKSELIDEIDEIIEKIENKNMKKDIVQNKKQADDEKLTISSKTEATSTTSAN